MVVRLLSEAPVKPVEWLWKGYLPLGKLVVLDGDGGMGKSTIMYDIASRITTGRAMPDGSEGVDGGVVLVEMEDEDGEVIRPRIEKMGGNPARIASLGLVATGELDERGEEMLTPFLLDGRGIEQLEEAIDAVNAKLVVINPIMTVLAGVVDTYKDASVKQALYPLVRLASEKGVTIVIVRHTNKQGSSNATNLGTASKAFINTARSGILIAPSPDDGQVRVFANIKSNLSKPMPLLEFSLESDEDEIAYVKWRGKSEYSVAQLVGAVATGKTYNDVQKFLMENSPVVETRDVIAAFPDIPSGTIRQTIDKLRKKGVIRSNGRGSWRIVDVMSSGQVDDGEDYYEEDEESEEIA